MTRLGRGYVSLTAQTKWFLIQEARQCILEMVTAWVFKLLRQT